MHHGDPWSWLSAGAEDWHACQDHCNSCHIPEGRKGIQRGEKGGEGGREGGREVGRGGEEGRREMWGEGGGGKREWEKEGREVEWGGDGQFAKVDLLMVFVTLTGVRVDMVVTNLSRC